MRDVLRWQFRLAWSLGAEVHFPALTDENCLWRPTPDAWTVHRDGNGVWREDWQVPEPDPAPPSTIGWLTWHLVWWWRDLRSRADGGRPVTRGQSPWPGGADAVRSALLDLHAGWDAAFDRWTDADLERPFAFPWPRPRPRWCLNSTRHAPWPSCTAGAGNRCR